MDYRSFGEVNVSEIGLGTWQLGGDWSAVPEEEAIAILNAFANSGGNFIDTADVYGMGTSEKLVGRFLAQTQSEMFVATKLGRRHDEGNGWPVNFSYDHMRSHVESSIVNLGVETIFLEQLHCIPKEVLEEGKVFTHLRQLQHEKLIQHWGASVETVEEGLICLQQEGIASLQIIFNIFRQTAMEELLERASERNVAIIVRLPLASGLLSGKFSENTVFDKNDHRNFNANGEAFNVGETFSGLKFPEGVELAREVAGMLPDDRTAQWALRWILDHPQVTTIIPGASRQSQVETNMAASALPPLGAEVHDRLSDFYSRKVKRAVRGAI